MTATREQTRRTPPRFVIRTFWMLHRAALRVTGGRFGLAEPESRSRFGMLRLATVGRRSGQRRVAIVGYFEHGPDLVTLAMNGWGDTAPAWWLNLQAQPDTTVELPTGPRAVRARMAVGEERERLWAMFGAYPGWGDDLDGLAARRSVQTAVVVLEPRGSGTDPVTFASHTLPAPAPRPVIGRPWLSSRLLWLVPGLAIGLYAGAQAGERGLGLAVLLLFGIIPHLPVLLAVGQRHAPGQLAPRAVPLFNVMHHPLPPLVILGVAAAGILSPFWLVASLAWLSHIVVDLAFGHGLRTPDGWRAPLRGLR